MHIAQNKKSYFDENSLNLVFIRNRKEAIFTIISVTNTIGLQKCGQSGAFLLTLNLKNPNPKFQENP